MTATPKPIVTELAIAEPKIEVDYDLAWEVLNDASSWRIASERESILAEEFGITSAKHLPYIETKDVQELASKLKKVPARQLTTFFNM